MRNFIVGIITALIVAGIIGAIIWFAVLPRLDWSANQRPSSVERAIARNVLARWIQRNAGTNTNPLTPTSENLKVAQAEYGEHCAPCHALDGSARNRFEADFYPPVMKLTGSVQKLSDADIYFIVANGISLTAMPGFGKTHSSQDLWSAILWVRHLAHLSPAEKATIELRMKTQTAGHERTIRH